MNNTLDELLCQRYPLIFADRNRPPEESGMGRGFECGDGWYDVIDALCESIQFSIDHEDGIPQVVATQVKAKFGTLRFRVNGGSPEVRGMIHMAESFSLRVCDQCGAPGTFSKNTLMVRCQKHADAQYPLSGGT